jgi:hypothetical protein
MAGLRSINNPLNNYLPHLVRREPLAQIMAFTDQGKLTDVGKPANNVYDLQFRLLDAVVGANQAGLKPVREDVAASNGLYTLTFDFGAAASSEAFIRCAVGSGRDRVLVRWPGTKGDFLVSLAFFALTSQNATTK